MKLIIYFAVMLLAINLVSAQDYELEDYPQPHVRSGVYNTQIVTGVSGTSSDVIAAIEINEYLNDFAQVPLGSTVLDNEVADKERNLILIGSPCDNKLMAQMLGNPIPCDAGMPEIGGVLHIINYKTYSHLLVTGKDPDDVRRAARALREYDTYEDYLYSKTVKIEGSIEDDLFIDKYDYDPLKDKQEAIVTGAEVFCENHSECLEDEKCSPEIGCEKLDCPSGFRAANHTCIEIPKEILKEEEENRTKELEKDIVVPGPKSFFDTIVNFFKNIFI